MHDLVKHESTGACLAVELECTFFEVIDACARGSPTSFKYIPPAGDVACRCDATEAPCPEVAADLEAAALAPCPVATEVDAVATEGLEAAVDLEAAASGPCLAAMEVGAVATEGPCLEAIEAVALAAAAEAVAASEVRPVTESPRR